MSSSVLGKYREKIDALVEKHFDEAVDDLSKFLQFQTVYESAPVEKRVYFQVQRDKAFEYLRKMTGRMGFTFRMVGDRVGVIEFGRGNETLGLLLHLDVVPGGSGWTHPPFSGAVEDGCIWGRGAQDDKGPLIQMLHAMRAAKDAGIPFKRKVRMIVGSMEETGNWEDIKDYLTKEDPPDFSVVPDSAFPITNGEKGLLIAQVDFGWQNPIYVAAGLRLIEIHAGERNNVVPDFAKIVLLTGEKSRAKETLNKIIEAFQKEHPQARIQLIDAGDGHLELHFQGRSAHASLPFDGHNAAADALAFAANLDEEGDLAKYIGALCGAAADTTGKYFQIDRRHPVLDVTTSCLCLLKIEEGAARATFNIRHPLGITVPEILESMQRKMTNEAQGAKLKAPAVSQDGDAYEPLLVDPDDFPGAIGSLQEAFHNVTGREPELVAMGGTTYAKTLPNAVNFGPVLLAEEQKLAHQPDERVKLEHHKRNIRIYARAIASLVNCKELKKMD